MIRPALFVDFSAVPPPSLQDEARPAEIQVATSNAVTGDVFTGLPSLPGHNGQFTTLAFGEEGGIFDYMDPQGDVKKEKEEEQTLLSQQELASLQETTADRVKTLNTQKDFREKVLAYYQSLAPALGDQILPLMSMVKDQLSQLDGQLSALQHQASTLSLATRNMATISQAELLLQNIHGFTPLSLEGETMDHLAQLAIREHGQESNLSIQPQLNPFKKQSLTP